MKKLFKGLIASTIALSMVACSSTTESSTATATPAEESEDVTVDILIIGSGAAGVSAAIKASEEASDASILVVEKNGITGGASMMGRVGTNAGGAEIQMAMETPYTADEFYEYAKSWDYGYDKIGYRVVPVSDDFASAFAYNSGKTVDWLVSLGMELVAKDGNHSVQLADSSQGGFGEVMMGYLQTALESKENVEVRTNTKATKLLQDENGTVVGATVSDKEGEYTINAKAVLVATGGYASADSEFYQTYAPEWDGYYSASAAGSTGDGIVMVDEVGGQLLGMDAITATSVTIGEANTSGAVSVDSSMKTGAVLVNKEGKRFVNEASGTATRVDAIKEQTNQEAYIIADDATLEASSDLQSANEKGLLVVADSLEELAEQLGIDATALTETFATYAENAANGTDEFGKEEITTDFSSSEKYYGSVVKSARRITTGGIVTDGNAEVLDADGNAISGLYAAGETTAYGAHPIAASTTFGLIAGEQMAEYISK